MNKEEIGARIREARKSRGYTQEQLAELADVASNYLGEIERGQKMPRMNVFVRIISALDVSADFILRNEIPSGKDYVFDDITQKLEKLNFDQRKTACDIIDAYIKNVIK